MLYVLHVKANLPEAEGPMEEKQRAEKSEKVAEKKFLCGNQTRNRRERKKSAAEQNKKFE